jgi:hypothetical protein
MTIYEVVFNGEVATQPMLTVLHYDIMGSVDFQALADRIGVLMIPDFLDQLVPAAVYSGITIREDIPGSVGLTYNFTGGNLTGSNVTTDVWNIIAANVEKRTTSGNRPALGRVYQGGIPAVAVAATGNLEAAYATAVQDAWEALREIVFDSSGTANMQIKASNPTAPNTVPYNPVTSMVTSLRPAKQSRRNWGT